MSKGAERCFSCGTEFLREIRYINENIKLKLNSYCSLKCFSFTKSKQRYLVCDNKDCKNIFRRAPKEISPNNFCSRSCAAIFRNIQKWGTPKEKSILSLTERLAIRVKAGRRGGINRWKNYQSKHTKESIIQIIQEFAKRNGRLPLKREMASADKFSRKFFGSWNKAIEVAGFEPNRVLFAKRQVAKDGHLCDSLAEKIIDDWFYERNINHEIHIRYPNTKFTADFIVNGIIIEFFGLSGELARYDELVKDKLNLIQERNLKFIPIYPKDIYPPSRLDKILSTIK